MRAVLERLSEDAHCLPQLHHVARALDDALDALAQAEAGDRAGRLAPPKPTPLAARHRDSD